MNIYIINALKEYTDEEIDNILNSKYIEIILNLILSEAFNLLTKKQRLNIINIINNTKTFEIASSIYYLLWDESAVTSGKIVELSKIISESIGQEQSYFAYISATYSGVLMNENCLEIVKTISKTQKGKIAEILSILAGDTNLSLNENYLELIKLVATSDSEKKADLSTSLAKNKHLLNANRVLYYVNKILLSKTDIEARTIYSEARKEIAKLKEQSESENNFWKFFNNNPEQAIFLLNTDVSDNEELTPYTKVRRK